MDLNYLFTAEQYRGRTVSYIELRDLACLKFIIVLVLASESQGGCPEDFDASVGGMYL